MSRYALQSVVSLEEGASAKSPRNCAGSGVVGVVVGELPQQTSLFNCGIVVDSVTHFVVR